MTVNALAAALSHGIPATIARTEPTVERMVRHGLVETVDAGGVTILRLTSRGRVAFSI